MSIQKELKSIEQKDPEVYQETLKVIVAFIEDLKVSIQDLIDSKRDTSSLTSLSESLVGTRSDLPRHLVETISKCFSTCENPEEIEEAREYLLRYLQLAYGI